MLKLCFTDAAYKQRQSLVLSTWVPKPKERHITISLGTKINMNEKIIDELFVRISELNKKQAELKEMEDSDDFLKEDAFMKSSVHLGEDETSSTASERSIRAKKLKRIEELNLKLFSDDITKTFGKEFLSGSFQESEEGFDPEDLLKHLWYRAKKTNNPMLAKAIAFISKEKGFDNLCCDILVDSLISDYDELISLELKIEDMEYQGIKGEGEDDAEFPELIS